MRQALTKTISTALKPTPKPLTVVNSTHKTGTEPLAHMKITDNWAYSTLEYPLDLQQRSDLVYYMMFYVNVMDTHRSAYSSYDSGMPGKRQSELESLLVKSFEDKEIILETTSQLKLQDVFNKIKNGLFYFGHDTGFMHLSASLNIPVLAIYGDIPPYNYSKYMRSIVLQDNSQGNSLLIFGYEYGESIEKKM